MPRISKKVREEINRLYNNGEGLSLAEIARQTMVSYSSVYLMTSVRQRINPETGQGFASRTEYQEHLVKQKGFASYAEYLEHLVRQRINPETGQGFASYAEYLEHLARQRQKGPENQELGDLIKKGLKRLGKPQRWLAEQLGITGSAISRYASGITTPRKSLQAKLFEVLELPYSTIDDLLKE